MAIKATPPFTTFNHVWLLIAVAFLVPQIAIANWQCHLIRPPNFWDCGLATPLPLSFTSSTTIASPPITTPIAPPEFTVPASQITIPDVMPLTTGELPPPPIDPTLTDIEQSSGASYQSHLAHSTAQLEHFERNNSATEPLWILPPQVIPPSPDSVLPVQQMVRERGYLDTPPTIAMAGEELADFTIAQVHQGLSWDYCGPRPIALGLSPISSLPTTTTPIDIDANSVIYQGDTDIAELNGDIQVTRGNQRIDAATLRWHRTTSELESDGKILFDMPGLRVIGQNARFNLDQDHGQISDAHYRFSGNVNLRGHAEKIVIHHPQLIQFDNLFHTACRPGDTAWSLQARRMDIDRAQGRGIAHHARLRIKDVPILYTPYLSFPIDNRRQTGFLIPSIGSTDTTGIDLSLPYYLNLAPNVDATLTPRIMTERGLMLGGEMRYLTPFDRGLLNVEVIPEDRQYESGATWRGAIRMKQAGHFGQNWQTHLDYSVVSDDQYLEDFGNSLEVTSTRRLLQQGDLTYFARDWSLLMRAEAFQAIDPELSPTDRPYGRLPQLLLTTRPFTLASGLETRLEAEYDLFDHDHRVHGQRIAVQPQFNWPVVRSYGHLIPSMRLSFADYVLNDVTPGQSDSPAYAIPSIDLDGKLIFERTITNQQHQWLQTLEPRLYYVYTPYEDQSDIPIFDSSELNFSFANLFRPNRFTGRDRIGDANQLTLGLTTRTLNQITGDEQFRLSVGQIYYFTDQRVQIAGPAEPGGSSPFAGEFAAHLFGHWNGRASFQWDADHEESVWQKRSIGLQYHHPNRQLLNIAYRFDTGNDATTSYEDGDVSFRLPINPKVEMVGRWLYSILHEQTMEAIAGVEYGSCCWRVRFVGRHFKNRPDSSGSHSVMLQVELAGLGKIGSSIDQFLAREIYDY
ncbi:LPS-assembly protein LptD [Thiospirillum jenense]|uniref:LPS-assembly protein LptD n=1 Tax=Thiospirillum jenense TaxID=1653858 RepID=A0A839HLE5_9GAMM|nr:LPS assembly protein LptD [Thiospirillum jenense]MBB1127149.1 LPS assembly protein LptD [Thiospirillum jenense]